MAIAFVASYGNVWTAGTPKTASVTVAAGDCLVVIGQAHTAAATVSTPTGGTGLTYTLQTSAHATGSPAGFMWTTFPASGQTYTISVGCASGFAWGFIALRFTGVASVGTEASRNDGSIGTDTEPFTPTTAHSAIAMLVSDTSAGGAATYSTATAGAFTEKSTGTANSVWAGYYADCGIVAAKTIGATVPSGATNVVCAIELVPTVVASTAKPRRLLVVTQAMKRASYY
jgi:hypothetical protein